MARTIRAVLAAALLAAGGCATATDPWQGDAGSPRVVVTIAPLESFVRAVGGDRVAVRCLCIDKGPHDYRVDHTDARLLDRADLFLSIGLTLDDSFADPMTRMVRRNDLRHVKLGERLPKESLLATTCACCARGEHGHAHTHGEHDPHVWLGTDEAVRLVEMIGEELGRADPDGADGYRKNAAAYVERLRKLRGDGRAALADRAVRRIVSFHAALGYFARSFGLEVAGVIQEGPGDEPTPGQRDDIIKLCSDPSKPVGAITVEPQYPASSSAGVIRMELKGKVPLVPVDPLETADRGDLAREGGDWYLSRVRQNVMALRDALPAKTKP